MANLHRHGTVVLGHQGSKAEEISRNPLCSPSQTTKEPIALAPVPSEPSAMSSEGTVLDETEAGTSEAEWPHEEAE